MLETSNTTWRSMGTTSSVEVIFVLPYSNVHTHCCPTACTRIALELGVCSDERTIIPQKSRKTTRTTETEIQMIVAGP